jgi:hypothetical protein
LYLNPSLCVASSLSTVEQARDYWIANSNILSNTRVNLDFVPSALDPIVFIGEHKNKNVLDVSALNKLISQANALDIEDGIQQEEGRCLDDHLKNGTFEVPTIYRGAVNIDSNVLQFDQPGDPTAFRITPSNLSVGDRIKLIKGHGVPMLATVCNILDDRTFVVDQLHPPFDFFAPYTVWGIELIDPLRIARINYLRLFDQVNSFRSNGSQITPDVEVNISSNFNDALYTLLYPDARGLNRDLAYLDYTSRYGNNDVRVANVVDLLSSCSSYSSYSSYSSCHPCIAHSNGSNGIFPSHSEVYFSRANITQVLNLDMNQETGRVIWNGLSLYYVTDDPYRALTDVSPYYQGLITEWAIKSYIHNLFWPLATFSNINVLGTANFYGHVTMCNLTIKDLTVTDHLTTKFLDCTSNAAFGASVTVNETISGARIGIGYGADRDRTTPSYPGCCEINTCNVVVANLYADQTLFVKETMQVSGNVIGTTATFGSDVSGKRFGIGPLALDFLVESKGPIHTLDSLLITSNLLAANAEVTGFLTGGNAYFDNATVSYQLNSPWVTTSNLLTRTLQTDTINVTQSLTCLSGSVTSLSGRFQSALTTGPSTCEGLLTTSNLNVKHQTFLEGYVNIGSPSFHGEIVLTVEGIVQAQNIDPSSDLKLKQNVRGASQKRNVIPDLIVREFEYLHEPGKNKLGFIAQEMERVFPDAVFEAKGYRASVQRFFTMVNNSCIDFSMNLDDELVADSINKKENKYKLSINDKIIIGHINKEKSHSIYTVVSLGEGEEEGEGDRNRVTVEPSITNNNTIDINHIDKIFVEAIIYEKVKMIDYAQVIASLCLEVQDLRRELRKDRAITNCHGVDLGQLCP